MKGLVSDVNYMSPPTRAALLLVLTDRFQGDTEIVRELFESAVQQAGLQNGGHFARNLTIELARHKAFFTENIES